MLRIHNFKSKTNFGDQLVGPILKWICNEDIKWVDSQYNGKLLCVGSELALNLKKPNDVIWGYGAKLPRNIKIPPETKVLALRGPNTALLVQGCQCKVFGDPALFTPRFYNPEGMKKIYDICVIPHFTDAQYFNINDPKIKVVDILSDKWELINNMHRSNLILSTSLHGCIVAEAYGFPVVWIKPKGSIVGGLEFKWNDYFSSTGRDEQEAFLLDDPITIPALIKATSKILPKAIINTTELEKVWRDFYSSNEIGRIKE